VRVRRRHHVEAHGAGRATSPLRSTGSRCYVQPIVNRDPRRQVVLVRCGRRTCALAVQDVVETLRPLPVSPLVGTAPFVAGAAVIRGEPVPVVDLAVFLGDAAPAPPGRFVVVRCGARRAVLAVEAVLGLSELARDAEGIAPLLGCAAAGAVEALSASDRELLLVLRAARVVPDAAWCALDAAPERRP
jgi:purine-binding chemotaxis protein CheW